MFSRVKGLLESLEGDTQRNFEVKASSSAFLLLFTLLVAVYCAWVLSFPVFPTQDGPIHLYYAKILSKLYSGPSVYSEYFSIRHPLPPYAVHYFILIGLYQLVSAVTAEKLVICLILVLTSFGFLHLVKSVAGHSPVLALIGIPLSLNWTVGMGFHNYGLSLGLSLFAISFWVRARTRDSNRARVAFVCLTFSMLFTHPVPLLMTLLVSGMDLALGTSMALRSGETAALFRTRRQRADLLTLCAGSLPLAYIALFVSGTRTAQDLHVLQLGMLRDLLIGRPLLLVEGTAGSLVYLLILFVLAAIGMMVAVYDLLQVWNSRQSNGRSALAATAIALTAFYPVIPRSLNGSNYFADRLVVYICLFLVVIMTPLFGAVTLRFRNIAGGVCVFISLYVLAIYDSDIRKVAHVMDRLEHANLVAPGPRGIFVDPPGIPVDVPLTYDPYIWSAARYFRETSTIMMNAPWLDLPILPIAAKDRLLARHFPGKLLNFPDRFTDLLLSDRKTRSEIGNQLDFILFMGVSGDKPESRDRVVEQRWPHPWTCTREDWFALCAAGNHPRKAVQ